MPPRTPVTQVIIVVKPDGDDLKFRIVVPAWIGHACSSVVTIKAGPAGWNGNPYGVYGDAIEDYIGCDKHDVSISVARCHGGEI
jgi:hypothetical protein